MNPLRAPGGRTETALNMKDTEQTCTESITHDTYTSRTQSINDWCKLTRGRARHRWRSENTWTGVFLASRSDTQRCSIATLDNQPHVWSSPRRALLRGKKSLLTRGDDDFIISLIPTVGLVFDRLIYKVLRASWGGWNTPPFLAGGYNG